MSAADEAKARARELAIAQGLEPHDEDWAPSERQERFLELSCFEALYGGSAGGGKSDALLVDAASGIGRGYGSGYNAILFRRTFQDLERSLILRSQELYPRLGGVFNATKHSWRFPGGERITFAHMIHERDALDHKSAAYQFIGFDELTSFTEYQYLYLFSRARSARGVPCRVRAATNPGDIGHEWVRARWFDWLSRKTQRPARPGEVRHFKRAGDVEIEVPRGTPDALGRTFIPARLEDNPHLAANDPEYAARIDAMPRLEREQLRNGDWDAVPASKDYWNRELVRVLRAPPSDVIARCRAWDFASSENRKADFSAGGRVSWTRSGLFVVEHMEHFQGAPDEVHRRFEAKGAADKAFDPRCAQVIPRDPGAAGALVVADFQRRYPALTIRARVPSGQKSARFMPVSSRALAGNVAVVADGTWDVEGLHAELEALWTGLHDDRADALSDGYAEVTGQPDTTFTRHTRGKSTR